MAGFPILGIVFLFLTCFKGKKVYKDGNADGLITSLQVIRKATNNFHPRNELSRGKYGIVYKGKLANGDKIAVKRFKRMCSEALIRVYWLYAIEHCRLVTLLGFCIKEHERVLVYEYMAEGALSKHLLCRDRHLPWIKRLVIALDVAQAIGYLHNLVANDAIFHGELNSSNILLDCDFRAKVSDFGLVTLVPNDYQFSVATSKSVYIAPEYKGRVEDISGKADVFSYGVVLMELLIGLNDKGGNLVEWFKGIIGSTKELEAAIDPVLKLNDRSFNFESMVIVAQLADQCTAENPCLRPTMGFVVDKLTTLLVRLNAAEDGNSSRSRGTRFGHLLACNTTEKGSSSHSTNERMKGKGSSSHSTNERMKGKAEEGEP